MFYYITSVAYPPLTYSVTFPPPSPKFGNLLHQYGNRMPLYATRQREMGLLLSLFSVYIQCKFRASLGAAKGTIASDKLFFNRTNIYKTP